METTISKEQEEQIQQMAHFARLANDFAKYCLGIGVSIEEALPMFTAIAQRNYVKQKNNYE